MAKSKKKKEKTKAISNISKGVSNVWNSQDGDSFRSGLFYGMGATVASGIVSFGKKIFDDLTKR